MDVPPQSWPMRAGRPSSERAGGENPRCCLKQAPARAPELCQGGFLPAGGAGAPRREAGVSARLPGGGTRS